MPDHILLLPLPVLTMRYGFLIRNDRKNCFHQPEFIGIAGPVTDFFSVIHGMLLQGEKT